MKVKMPTFIHIKQAVQVARRGGKTYKFGKKRIKVEYDQGSWCGTECCVWGHALLLAGNTQLANPVSHSAAADLSREARDEFESKSKRHRAIARMMRCSEGEVLDVIGKLANTKNPVKKVLEKAKKHSNEDVADYAEVTLYDL